MGALSFRWAWFPFKVLREAKVARAPDLPIAARVPRNSLTLRFAPHRPRANARPDA